MQILNLKVSPISKILLNIHKMTLLFYNIPS
jgi:hypothetical protein